MYKKIALVADSIWIIGLAVAIYGKVCNADLIWTGIWLIALGIVVGIWNLLVFLKNK
jgi:hypothetical protein